jgi:hypothetical protein
VQQWLPRFQEDNPQLNVETTLQPGAHPTLNAAYRERAAICAAAAPIPDLPHRSDC